MDKAWKPHIRLAIGRKVRELRLARQFTQAALSTRLGLSQARLSVIEKGDGSFSAEQFLELLRIFNVPAQAFVPGKRDPEGLVQNALARLGASHLVEAPDLLPSEHLEEVEAVIREVLVDGQNPRQVAALAPILARHFARINLNRLWARFVDYRLERRFGWALENTAEALHSLIPALTRLESAPLRKAEATFRTFLASRFPTLEENARGIDLDLLDKGLSSKTIQDLTLHASKPSDRWAIVTALQVEDFAEALRASTRAPMPRRNRDAV